MYIFVDLCRFFSWVGTLSSKFVTNLVFFNIHVHGGNFGYNRYYSTFITVRCLMMYNIILCSIDRMKKKPRLQD